MFNTKLSQIGKSNTLNAQQMSQTKGGTHWDLIVKVNNEFEKGTDKYLYNEFGELELIECDRRRKKVNL